MKKVICYNVEELLKILPNHQFRKIQRIAEDDEYYSDKKHYYFVSPEVESIHVWLGLFGNTMHIKLLDQTTVDAHSSNVNTNDTSLIRIKKNRYVSPDLILFNENWVEATHDLVQWIRLFAVLGEDIPDLDQYLSQISTFYMIEEEIMYNGVPTPSKHGTSWGYSSNPLVLQESEIEHVLNGIDDELLREKIKCILYARIFQKKG